MCDSTKNVQLNADAILAKVKEDGQIISCSFDNAGDGGIYHYLRNNDNYILSASYNVGSANINTIDIPNIINIGSNIMVRFTSPDISPYTYYGYKVSINEECSTGIVEVGIRDLSMLFDGSLFNKPKVSNQNFLKKLFNRNNRFNARDNREYISPGFENESGISKIDLPDTVISRLEELYKLDNEIVELLSKRYGLTAFIYLVPIGLENIDWSKSKNSINLCNKIYDALSLVKNNLVNNRDWVDGPLVKIEQIGLCRIHGLNIIKLVPKGTDEAYAAFTGNSNMATVEALISSKSKAGYSLNLVKKIIGISSMGISPSYEFSYTPKEEAGKYALVSTEFGLMILSDKVADVINGKYNPVMTEKHLLGICVPYDFDFKESFKAKYI